MVQSKSTSFLWLLIAQMIATASIVDSHFDLNEAPEEEEEFQDSREEFEPPASTPIPVKVVVPAKRCNKKITPEFYAKVERLFKVLKVCDVEDFDVNKIPLPDNISAESKAMMALEKVGRSNLIKKSDKAKYNRIMKNCAKYAEAVNSKTESKMSMDSQLSGGTWEERLARLKDSVLDNFRDRFADSSAEPSVTYIPTVSDTTERPSYQTPVARLQNTYDLTEVENTGERRFIQFF